MRLGGTPPLGLIAQEELTGRCVELFQKIAKTPSNRINGEEIASIICGYATAVAPLRWGTPKVIVERSVLEYAHSIRIAFYTGDRGRRKLRFGLDIAIDRFSLDPW